MRLIDADALYERTAEWEAQALHMVEVTMNDEDKTEWRKWSAVLAERSAFKHDIADAPTIEPEPSEVARDIATIIENEKDMRVIAQPVRKGKWIPTDPGARIKHSFKCSLCGSYIDTFCINSDINYCPNCGHPMMRGEEDETN